MQSQLNLIYLAACLLVVVVLCEATEVQKCQGTNLKKIDSNDVSITSCTKGVCKLRKKSEIHVQVNFTSDGDLNDLTTYCTGEIFGLPLPFIGVDSTSSNDDIYNEDGETKATLPLKSGQSYIYKKTFQVLELYPRVSALVRWSLSSSTDNQEVFCFEIPIKIV